MLPDHITNPAHYTVGKIQPIDVIEDWGLPFHIANVVKYIARSPYKGDTIGDLQKAIYYLNRYVDWLKKIEEPRFKNLDFGDEKNVF